jgi:Tol biopolymer transport system component
MEPGPPRDRISDLYHRALDCTPEERNAFLQRACDGDAALRQEIESLLEYESHCSGFLETPAAVVAGDFARTSDKSQMIGRQLGPYTIVSPLGAGGMGEVYRAHDSKLGRDVAIKILPSHFTADPERRSRFSREARLLATLNHPHIGAIYGLEEADGVTALVLELVEGPTLADRLARGPLPITAAVTIARQIAEALEAAHEKGIVHRDLKPANVVLQSSANASGVPSGAVRAKVLDFGLAKTMTVGLDGDLTQRPSGSLDGTEEGRILGTPAYMSPEQARGQAVDKRTDIWAFGCVFYEMLTGRQAFAGNTMSDTFVSILEREPDWTALPSPTPASIRTLLQRCLRKDPGKRLRDIADALIEIDERDAASTSAGTGVGRVGRWWRAAIIAASAAVALLAVAGVAWMFWPVTRPTQQPPIPRRLTFDPGLQTDPTFSPDGRYIAYSSNKSGNFDIYMQPVAGGNALPVTTDPAHDTQPDWSPIDSRIVFRSERDGGGLFLAPATGGRAARLSTFGYRPRWSPDGLRVLFVESDLVKHHGGVYAVRLDGSPPEAIDTKGLTNSLRDYGSVGWHPDSERVTFFSARPLQVATVDVTRRTTERSDVPLQVQEGFRDQRLSIWSTEPLVWAPDATVVYFVGLSSGLLNIWSLDVDPRTLAITGGPHRITSMPETNESIALVRSGSGIAFGAADRPYRIMSYPLDASGRRIPGPPAGMTPPELYATSPDLTPDGSRLLFQVGQPGSGTGRRELRIIGDGPERTVAVDETLGQSENRDFPRWSPDGTRIAYLHTRQDRAAPASKPILVRSLVLLDVKTGRESQLTTPFSDSKYGQEIAYGWSPDGRFVVSSSGRYKPGQMAIALVPVSAAPKAETEATIVTMSAEYELWNTGMSRNERWICFNAVKDETSKLGIVETKTGTRQWLTDTTVWVDKPRWSPDGRLIYFISKRGGLFNVWAVEFDPDRGTNLGEPFQVTRFDGSGEFIPPNMDRVELAVGRGRLAIPVVKPTGGIWMLENPNR